MKYQLKTYQNLIGNKVTYAFFIFAIAGVLEGMGLMAFIPILETISTKDTITLGEVHRNLAVLDTLFINTPYVVFLASLLTVVLLLFILKSILILVSHRLISHYKAELGYQAKTKMIDGIMGCRYSFIMRQSTAKIDNIMTEQITKMQLGFEFTIKSAAQIIITLIYFTIALYINVVFTISCVLCALLVSIVFSYVNRHVTQLSQDLARKKIDYSNDVGQLSKSIAYMIGTNVIEKVTQPLNNKGYGIKMLEAKMGFWLAFTNSLREPFALLILAFGILISVNILDRSFYSIIVTLVLIYKSLTSALLSQKLFQNSLDHTGSTQLYSDFVKELNKNERKSAGVKQIGSVHEIEFKDVTYNYNSSGQTSDIGPISFRASRGQIISIFGPSGCGKSTIIKMLLGLLKPVDGEIRINGDHLDSYKLLDYNQNFSWASDESLIFSGSLWENILLNFDIPENIRRKNNKLLRYLNISGLDKILQQKKSTTDMLLKTGGTDLSSGQRQRVIIARELFKESSVLILDEATNALDQESQSNLLNEIRLLRRDTITFIISHDPKVNEFADVIVCLDSNKEH